MLLSCSLLEIFQPASNAALATVTSSISKLMKTVNSAQTSVKDIRHPSLRLKSSGTGSYSKKFRFPETCSPFPWDVMTGSGKHDHLHCRQRLTAISGGIFSLSYLLPKYNCIKPEMPPRAVKSKAAFPVLDILENGLC